MTPTKIRITKIEVTDFPATDENGAGWDLLSGADIYPVILKGSNVLWTSSRYFEDASPSSLYSFTSCNSDSYFLNSLFEYMLF